MNMELLFARRYNRETYTFYIVHDYYDARPFEYIRIETPINCFGYHDVILYSTSGEPYTLYRGCPRWILNRCTETLVKHGYGYLIGR